MQKGDVGMGHRANFVVIRNAQAKAYYDQWAGMGCIYSFADGPDEACDAISQFEEADGLLDWAFAEGGYLIDFDEKKAIVFGQPIDLDEFAGSDGDADEQLPESNSPFKQGGLPFLEHIGPSWAGWKLVWDDHGVDAFAAHLRRRNIADIAVEPASHPPDTAEPIEYRA
jgi:hypothetical protein